MITFFSTSSTTSQIYAVVHRDPFSAADLEKLTWLMNGATPLPESTLEGIYKGPRAEMISPWSTNAVEIISNMNIVGVERVELLEPATADAEYDRMLQRIYTNPGQTLFDTDAKPEPIRTISDLAAYNEQEGLALSQEEIDYLEGLSKKLGRLLTDSEVFGFSQVNSEHCRHKIFNGEFVIDGTPKEKSLFQLIKSTSAANPNGIVSAYKDNVAFTKGPVYWQFAPEAPHTSSFYTPSLQRSVFSLKAETHNFPTTVEPFNGAATGSGGEIRDRMSGGRASIPVAGTAVYMTSYPRLEENESKSWEKILDPRQWLYQTPQEILIKASNGASDYGNKFGQPLIVGSLLTFEHQESKQTATYGYDKVLMLAGGVGYARDEWAKKETPKTKQDVVVLGGDNYRIGLGGGAVSSVATGELSSGIELNAIQRSNPEMQKRVFNVVRSLSEKAENPIVSIHDHGAGGHLNCLTELIEHTGGEVDIDALPVGDPTLSAREIIGNESQERIGLLIKSKDWKQIEQIAQRERAPIYKVGQTSNDHQLRFVSNKEGAAIDLAVDDLLGNTPQTTITDSTVKHRYAAVKYNSQEIEKHLDQVLQLEAVACKDWLTNKVDRSVTGLVARQQTCGELQLPLADFGAFSSDYEGEVGLATSIGHAPQAALIDAAKGSKLAIAEALTNIVFAPIDGGLRSISLSANWMWPCKNKGEDARLYQAVESAAHFATALGINIPTGKDSLSMTQKYPDGKQVLSPGTVVISAAAPIYEIRKIVTPNLKEWKEGYGLLYIDLSGDKPRLGGSALAQSLGQLGDSCPDVVDVDYFGYVFNVIQRMILLDLVEAGHDVSAGGLITTLLEMNFPNVRTGLSVHCFEESDEELFEFLFAENPGVVLQVSDLTKSWHFLASMGVECKVLMEYGMDMEDGMLSIYNNEQEVVNLDICKKRDLWYRNSYLLDRLQTVPTLAQERYFHYKWQPVQYRMPHNFDGTLHGLGIYAEESSFVAEHNIQPVAAVLRDKGSNGERELAYALHLAGFAVKDVHLTDLISGREDLSDVSFLAFCGGFSNSDVFGSAKGWAGGILYNPKAKQAIDNFYKRTDTLSIGVCNGCQLMAELGVLYPEHEEKHQMCHNLSGKFESSFLALDIPANNSVMFSSLAGSRIGVWVAHGEGRFSFPYAIDRYNVAARYAYDTYPGNPNGSPYAVAALASENGRHLAIMPHPERAIFPWQCGYYPQEYNHHEVTPWMQAFRHAYDWIVERMLVQIDCNEDEE